MNTHHNLTVPYVKCECVFCLRVTQVGGVRLLGYFCREFQVFFMIYDNSHTPPLKAFPFLL